MNSVLAAVSEEFPCHFQCTSQITLRALCFYAHYTKVELSVVCTKVNVNMSRGYYRGRLSAAFNDPVVNP